MRTQKILSHTARMLISASPLPLPCQTCICVCCRVSSLSVLAQDVAVAVYISLSGLFLVSFWSLSTAFLARTTTCSLCRKLTSAPVSFSKRAARSYTGQPAAAGARGTGRAKRLPSYHTPHETGCGWSQCPVAELRGRLGLPGKCRSRQDVDQAIEGGKAGRPQKPGRPVRRRAEPGSEAATRACSLSAAGAWRTSSPPWDLGNRAGG